MYIKIDASDILGGTYQAEIIVESNDVVKPKITIPIALQANGISEYSAPVKILDFGEVMLGDTVSMPLAVINQGLGELIISGITSKTGAYFIKSLPVKIPAISESELYYSLVPSEVKVYDDTVVIFTNDPVNPTDTLIITGSGVLPVNINVDLTPIELEIEAGKVDLVTLSIGNTGVGLLNWEVNPILNSPPVLFMKQNYADWKLAVNQDRILQNTWITRANDRGIFNIAAEETYDNNTSPSNTLWSFGNTKELNASDYELWVDAVGNDPPSMIGNVISMWVLSEAKYFDILFNSWTSNANGGGFSYTRTEVPGWLKASANSGTVAQGSSEDISVILDATALNTGVYQAYLEIISNDPANKKQLIPVTINVTGQPTINTNPLTVDFTDAFLNFKDSVKLDIINTGSDNLMITDISTSLAVFSVNKKVLTVPPKQSRNIMVYFIPLAASNYTDTLVIASNDLDSALFEVPLSGNAVLPPVISISPLSYSKSLNYGETSVSTLKIKNTGDTDLELELYLQSTNPAVTIKKENWADWKLSLNQDRITDKVWITRADDQGLINLATENTYDNAVSPEGTLWSFGYTYENIPGNYDVWRDAVYPPPSMVDNMVSMYIISQNRYFDILFHDWTENGQGGGFSYTRTEVPAWLSLSSYSNTILPGDSAMVNLTFDATATLGGKYASEIVISSNDPANKLVKIPADILITGTSEISATDTLAFGNTFTDINYTLPLEISNSGTDTLRISNITAKSTNFSAASGSIVIEGNGKKSVNITFLAGTEGIYKDTLTIYSNASSNPELQVILTAKTIVMPSLFTPSELSYTLPADSIIYDTIKLENIGSTDLAYVFNISLDQVFVNLNQHFSDIIDQVPNSYNFIYDGTNSIDDGGNDMYDDGNFLNTNLGRVLYSDDIIKQGNVWFGDNTRYFTRELPRLFVMAADLNHIDQFFISGDNGADGGGTSDTTRLEYENLGITYQGFVKRVYNAGDPSINHLIIVRKDNSLVHKYTTNTNDDYHAVEGLDGTNRIYYLLYAGSGGTYINNAATQNIFKTFVDSILVVRDFNNYIQPPNWIENIWPTDTLAPGAEKLLPIVINTTGLKEGTYQKDITLDMSLPFNFTYNLPVTLKVENLTVLSPIADTTVNEGFVSFDLNLMDKFMTNRGGTPSFLAISSNTNVATASVNNALLHLTETGTGNTLVTVRVDDNHGTALFDDFMLTVNAAPKVSNSISDTTMNQGFAVHTVNLTGVFSDTDDTSLIYTALSSAINVVTVNIAGSTLTISEAGNGSSTITVDATDSRGLKASDVFTFTVNGKPVVSPISNITVNEGFASDTMNMTMYFSDPESGNLTFSALSSNTSVVTVSINGTTLTISEVGIGTSNITVTATDPLGAENSGEFSFTVNHVTGIELSNAGIKRLYPNPSYGIVYLELKNIPAADVLIEISDLSGRVIYLNKFPSVTGEIEINLSKLIKGIYLVKYSYNNINHFEKITLLN